MIKLVSFVVAIGISALALYLVRRGGSKEEKLTDKRARAEALKQLLALSDTSVSAENKPEKREEKKPLKPVPALPISTPAMTRQQRRAEQRRKDKIALAKSQHA